MSERTEKETKVYGIFQRIAGRYDRSNAFISLGLQKRWKKMLTDKVIRGFRKEQRFWMSAAEPGIYP